MGQSHERAIANRCFLCEEEDETVEHLLVHAKRLRIFWELFLATVGASWVFFPFSGRETLLSWQDARVGKKHKKVWLVASPCLFSTMRPSFVNKAKTYFFVIYGHGQICTMLIKLFFFGLDFMTVDEVDGCI